MALNLMKTNYRKKTSLSKKYILFFGIHSMREWNCSLTNLWSVVRLNVNAFRVCLGSILSKFWRFYLCKCIIFNYYANSPISFKIDWFYSKVHYFHYVKLQLELTMKFYILQVEAEYFHEDCFVCAQCFQEAVIPATGYLIYKYY